MSLRTFSDAARAPGDAPEYQLPANTNRAATRTHILILQKYLKRANRPKGRDAKLWGLRQILWVCDDSPAANISVILI